MTVFLTEGMTWQLGDNGLTLNTENVPGQAFIDIDKAAGFDSAPARSTKKDHEGVDGGFMDAEFETGRDIQLEGTLYSNGTDIEDTLDRLKADWAVSKTLVPLYYTTKGTSTRVLFVKPLGCAYSFDTGVRTGMTPVVFTAYAELPYIFETTLNSTLITVGSVITTGFAFPLGFPFGFGDTSSTSDGQNVFNGGNRSVPCTLSVTGPCAGPIIYNDTLGVNLSFPNLTLSSGDTMVIDTYYKTVRINGANRRSLLANAGWFNLVDGENFIRFRALTGTGTLTIQWRSAWR